MKLYPPHYLLLAIISMLITWSLGDSIPQTPVLMITGIILMILGFMLFFRSALSFRKAETGIVPFSKSTTLVLEGCYKFSRNPMYVGMNLLLVGLIITLANLYNIVYLIAFFFIVRNLFVLKEEKQMEDTFGEEYLSYKKKVRRWL